MSAKKKLKRSDSVGGQTLGSFIMGGLFFGAVFSQDIFLAEYKPGDPLMMMGFWGGIDHRD